MPLSIASQALRERKDRAKLEKQHADEAARCEVRHVDCAVRAADLGHWGSLPSFADRHIVIGRTSSETGLLSIAASVYSRESVRSRK